jgi:hypothetical protein
VKTTPSYLSLDETTDQLRRFYLILHHLFRCQAGWLPAVPRFRHKYLLGRILFEDSVNLTKLRARLAELHCREPLRAEPKEIQEFASCIAVAPSADAFLALAIGELRTVLLEFLKQYLAETDPVLNWPSHYPIRHAQLDLESTIRSLASEPLPALDETAARWVESRKRFARTALGLRSEAANPPPVQDDWPKPPFAESAREPGMPLTALQQVQQTAPPRTDAIAFEQFEFMHHAFELMFAESLASTLYETPEMPWEFHADLARQTWDELRHAEGGYRRCEQLGLARDQVPQVNSNYAFRQGLDPMRRFCLMTLVSEASSFGIKRDRLKSYIERGNIESERYMTFDICDEGAHVHYGHVWVPVFLKQSGQSLSVDELKQHCETVVRSSGRTVGEEIFKKKTAEY